MRFIEMAQISRTAKAVDVEYVRALKLFHW